MNFVKGRKRGDLDTDEMLALSLVRLLEVIGEAGNLVDRAYIDKYPDIPWKKMIGMRHRLIHGYFDINLDIVWDTVIKDLPNLVSQLEKIIDEEP
jgi:uncharacterized protein with HEPN domain